ncbi:MAG: hypothetical protein R3E92_00695 [Burkholderiaceae bacterium]
MNSTSGKSARVALRPARQRHAVHLGHVHVDDGQVEAFPSPSHRKACSGDSVSRARKPQRPVCSDRILRLVALSSTIRMPLPARSGCSPEKSRRLAGGNSATGAAMVKAEYRTVAGTFAFDPHRAPHQLGKPLADCQPKPVPPYLRVVELSAWLKLWNSSASGRAQPDAAVAHGELSYSRPSSAVARRNQHHLALFGELLRWTSGSAARRNRVTSPTMAAGTSPSNT